MTRFSREFTLSRAWQSMRAIFARDTTRPRWKRKHGDACVTVSVTARNGMSKDKSRGKAGNASAYTLLQVVTFPSIDYDTFFADL